MLKEIIAWKHTRFGTFGYNQTFEEREASNIDEETYACVIDKTIYNHKFRIVLELDYTILECNYEEYDSVSKCKEVVEQSITIHNRKLKIKNILDGL